MIALPSIAFEGFSGSAKGVTARRVGGRNILSCKCWPTGAATVAQVARRASLKKISKSWKLLSSEQMQEWDRLAEHAAGASVLGKKAELTGQNLYVRLNVNRAMAGEALLSTAPLSNAAIPNVEFTQVVITSDLVVLGGVKHEPAPLKLVVKMSVSQSAGISNGWSKTVIITPGMEDDWGEADVTHLYLKTIGVEPVPGEKVFVEAYWMDTSTGFAGLEARESVIVTGESHYQRRVKATMDNLDPTEESHVSSLDVDFSTGAPVAQFNAQCLGHSNVASSEVYLDQQLPSEIIGTGMCLGRSNDADGHINAQSYLVYMYNRSGKAQLTFAHRGGPYFTHTEVFGTGQITFKDYQAPNYVVLNAKVEFDPTNPAYQACQQLEITVPDLTIDRSTIGGVFVRFIETQHYSWGDAIYDGGTVLKSWIKDKNTIVVEKQSWFDQNGPLALYFVTMYAQLNQGANTIKGTKQRLTVTTDGNYLRFSSDTFVVVFDHWVFMHLQFSSCSYAQRDLPWEATFEQMPTDVTADVPVPGGGNQFHQDCYGMGECHIENKIFTMDRRVMGFWDTGREPFAFAFLVRDNSE